MWLLVCPLSPTLTNIHVFPFQKGYFNVHYNYFSGPLPNWVKMGSMFYFDVSNNALTGTLPQTLDMFELKHLHMEHNKFTGTIPRDYSVIGNRRIFEIYLNDNQLSGTFPRGPWHKVLPHRFLSTSTGSNWLFCVFADCLALMMIVVALSFQRMWTFPTTIWKEGFQEVFVNWASLKKAKP